MARMFTVQVTGEQSQTVEGIGRVKRIIEQYTSEEGSWRHENISHRLAHMRAGDAYCPVPGILITVEGMDDGDENDLDGEIEDGQRH